MLTLGLLLGCQEDCVCPEPEMPLKPDYHLLYSYAGSTIETKYVLTYSTKTGEVIDSAEYGGIPFVNMAFSHDGEYAVYTSNYNLDLGASETWVTETATGDTISYLLGVGGQAAILSPSDDYVLLMGGGLYAILSFPGLSIVYQDSVTNLGGGFHPRLNRVFAVYERAMDSLFVLDFLESPVVESSIPIRDSEGYPLLSTGILQITEHHLLLNPLIPDAAYFIQVYDVDSLTLLHEIQTPHLMVYRGVDLAPDGNRLFLAYNRGFERPWESGVDIYYFSTGNLVPYITQDEISCCYEQIAPTDIEFLPDGESFFILDGGTGFWFGPILQINTVTKEVIRVIRPDDGSTKLIRLNPKDWAN
jgi:hypothetical protein